jgi:ssDNA-binding Zn-finger/Zn-ribbon topoisomerase 1
MWLKFNFWKWYINFSPAKHRWNHFEIYNNSQYIYTHIIWWKFSLCIQNLIEEVYPLCSQCGSQDVYEKYMGDEGFIICNDCQSVEQGYRYVSLKELRRLGLD